MEYEYEPKAKAKGKGKSEGKTKSKEEPPPLRCRAQHPLKCMDFAEHCALRAAKGKGKGKEEDKGKGKAKGKGKGKAGTIPIRETMRPCFFRCPLFAHIDAMSAGIQRQVKLVAAPFTPWHLVGALNLQRVPCSL